MIRPQRGSTRTDTLLPYTTRVRSLSHAFSQPIAAEEVADAVTAFALAAPANGKIELGGPEKFHLDEIVAQTLALDTDTPPIVVDPDALYAGVRLDDDSLIPAKDDECGSTLFTAWLETASPPRKRCRCRSVRAALGRRRRDGQDRNGRGPGR